MMVSKSFCWVAAIAMVTACASGCGRGSAHRASADDASRTASDAVFAEDFESGTLAAWQDGVDPVRHRIVTNPASAQSGSRYLAVTYPGGRDGGWLTRFLAAGFETLYVSYYVRFPHGWRGGTKLIAFYGARADDRWSAAGKAAACPTGSDFFISMLVTEPGGDPGPVRFYTYYPGMAREPDGRTCWGRYGDGSETYADLLTLRPAAWHHVEFFVQLNTPARADGRQMFWLDDTLRGSWPALSLRTSTILELNAVQLTFSVSSGVAQTQQLDVDNLVVLTAPPRSVSVNHRAAR